MSYQPIPLDVNGRVAADDIILGVTDVVDAANSSTTPLLAGATFTGTAVNILNYKQIAVFVFSDQASAVNGLQIQFSTDGTNWDHTHSITTLAATGDMLQAHCHAKFYRVVFTNGGTNQTQFRLQTILRPIAGLGTIVEADDSIKNQDDAVLTKAIITGKNSLTGNSYVDVKATPDGGLMINQDILVDAANSSTANLAGGATFTGAASSNLTVTAIQVFLKTDQNCTVYVDQSQDGTNWDVTDRYDYWSAIGNFANTVNAVGSYYRVRVTNITTTTTTYFRLQAILVPVLSALPRSLSPDGWLQVQTNHVQDAIGFTQRYTPFGEQLAVPTARMIGSAFPGNTIDTNFWTPSVGTGGTAQNTLGLMTLSTGTTANNATSLTSVYIARYVSGQTNKFSTGLQLPDTGTVNNVRRWGAFTATDGIFYELNGTQFALVTRKNSVDTRVVNGTFNGTEGGTFPIDTGTHSYEIIYRTSDVWFVIDNKLIHSIKFTTTWASTAAQPIRFENTNSGGSTTNVSMNIFAGIIVKYGIPQTQPVAKSIAGAVTQVLKYGAGNLHSVLITANLGTSITLYDNTAGSGTIIATISPNQITTLDFKGVTFSNGLTVVTVGASISCAIIYE